MPRHTLDRKPKACRKTWNTEDMAAAVRMVREKKMGVKKASKHYDVPKTTLRRLASEVMSDPDTVVMKKLGRKPVFPEHMEEELLQHLLDMESIYFGLTRQDVRRLAFQLALHNNIEHPFRDERAGRAWLDHFLRRHKGRLSLRKPTSTSYARAEGFTQEQVASFFDLLEDLYKKHNLTAERVWNVDETGISVVQSKVPKIIGSKGKRQIGALSAAERGSLVTVICSMSAGGSFVPPMLIFPRKNMSDALMRGAPPGAIGRAHPSGWVQGNLFTQWLQHFIDRTKPTKESPVLLILDGHYSHTKNLDVINLARANHVLILSLPAHTTHKLQPLDRTFMGPLKTYYSEFIRQELLHGEKRLGPFDVAHLFGKAYLECTRGSIAVNGFRVTGIWPCNRNIFPESDFLAAQQTSETHNEHSQASSGPISCTNSNPPPSSDSMPTQSSPTTPSTTAASPISQVGYKSSLMSPKDIQPLPRPKPKSKRGRKPSSASVITGSPYKTTLEAAFHEKEVKQSKQGRGRGKRRVSVSQRECSAATLAQSQPSTSGLVPQHTRSSRRQMNRRLVFSGSSSESDSNASGALPDMLPVSPLQLPVGKEAPDNEDALCMFCDGAFKDDCRGEVWVKCEMCEQWAHTECAGAENDSCYVCDFCR